MFCSVPTPEESIWVGIQVLEVFRSSPDDFNVYPGLESTALKDVFAGCCNNNPLTVTMGEKSSKCK